MGEEGAGGTRFADWSGRWSMPTTDTFEYIMFVTGYAWNSLSYSLLKETNVNCLDKGEPSTKQVALARRGLFGGAEMVMEQ